MDENWWGIWVNDKRHDEKLNELRGPDFIEVNPVGSNGRRQLSYDRYLGLDKLLDAQIPGSRVPDERAFVITHQLFELAFKLAIFDAAIVATTMHALLGASDAEFMRLCALPSDDVFWRPASTAAARLRYATAEVLATFLKYLSQPHFSTDEFAAFRAVLQPASGFQSPQFRLLQRILGKAALFKLPIFPAKDFAFHYEDRKDSGMVGVDHQLILGHGQATVRASEGPLGAAGGLDDTAHRVLARVATINRLSESPVSKLERIWVDSTVSGLKALLDEHLGRLRVASDASTADRTKGIEEGQSEEELQRLVETEKKALEAVAEVGRVSEERLNAFTAAVEDLFRIENERRENLGLAGAGAVFVKRSLLDSGLLNILEHLVAADCALHTKGATPGPGEGNNFIKAHYGLARRIIKKLQEMNPQAPSGTGGGGYEYLKFALTYLYPDFPVLLAFRA